MRRSCRVRLDDEDESNDPDAGFGDPIAFARTDAGRAFSCARPAGTYKLEFFADAYGFQPGLAVVETPLDVTHKGRRETIRSSVGIFLTPAYARSRGFDVATLRARGLIVDPPGRGLGPNGAPGRP